MAKACTGAARELKAARDLIVGYEAHIAAAEDRIKIAYREIEALKGQGQLQSARAKELEGVIDAEKAQVGILLKQKDLQEKRIASLEKKLSRSRRFALIAGVVGVVGFLIASTK